jgi:hypothetical protein
MNSVVMQLQTLHQIAGFGEEVSENRGVACDFHLPLTHQ